MLCILPVSHFILQLFQHTLTTVLLSLQIKTGVFKCYKYFGKGNSGLWKIHKHPPRKLSTHEVLSLHRLDNTAGIVIKTQVQKE